ncbi:T-lymphocyte activation antigen CD86 [Anomaloglossus baeobatrachus]|uniref:T-lymphocyte activation antigen CD86 n=1 Tax=Anomaloglossus baeobatrachus TaxID=238106 RepID=UPI003F4FE802
MVPRIAVLVLYIVTSPCQAAPIDEITAYVSGMAELKCDFYQHQNNSKKVLIISWEKARKDDSEMDVVAELFSGIRKYNYIAGSYENRLIEFMPNGDLKMYNITMEDEGSYNCRVRIKSLSIEMLHHKELQLNILANYTIPEISNGSIQEQKVESIVNLHCSSGNGFPQPHGMLWTVSDNKGTKSVVCNLDPNTSCEIRKTSKTFNISSDFTMTVTSNTNVTCRVLAHRNASSETLQIVIKQDIIPPREENHHATYIVPCAILIVFTTAVVICCYKRKKKTCTGRQLLKNGEAPTETVTNNDLAQQQETTSFIENRDDF